MKQLIILIIASLFTLPVYAEEICEVITLDQSIKLALSKNLNIKIASQNFKIAEAKTAQAWSSVFPTLTLSTSYTKTQSSATSQKAIESNNLKLSFEQLIYSGSAFAAIKASKYGIELAKENLLSQTNNIIYNTTKTYYELIKLSSLINATKENKKLIKNTLEKISIMFEAGITNRQDLLRTEIQLNNTEQQLIDLNLQYQNTINNFNILIGLAWNKAIKPVTPQTNKKEIEGFDTYLELALKNRPDLNALNYQKKLYKTQVAVFESETMPSIIANGYKGLTNEKYSFDFDNNQDWMLNLAVSWKIFDGNNSGSQIKETESTIYKINEQYKNLKELIAVEVESALLNIISAKNKIKSAKKEVELAKENQFIANINYVNGTATNIEVIDSNASLLIAKSNLIDSTYEYDLAIANLEKVLGTSYKKTFNKGN